VKTSFRNIASQWAAQDPDAATAWAKGLPDGNGKSSALQGLVGGLAYHSDAKRARRILRCRCRRDQGVTRPSAKRHRPGANRDLNEAVAWVQQLPDGLAEAKTRSTRLAGNGRRTTPKAVADYAQTLPPGTAQNNLLGKRGPISGRQTDPQNGSGVGVQSSSGPGTE